MHILSRGSLPAIMRRTIEVLSFCTTVLPAIPHNHSIKRFISKLLLFADRSNPDTITSLPSDVEFVKDPFGAQPGRHQSFT